MAAASGSVTVIALLEVGLADRVVEELALVGAPVRRDGTTATRSGAPPSRCATCSTTHFSRIAHEGLGRVRRATEEDGGRVADPALELARDAVGLAARRAARRPRPRALRRRGGARPTASPRCGCRGSRSPSCRRGRWPRRCTSSRGRLRVRIPWRCPPFRWPLPDGVIGCLRADVTRQEGILSSGTSRDRSRGCPRWRRAGADVPCEQGDGAPDADRRRRRGGGRAHRDVPRCRAGPARGPGRQGRVRRRPRRLPGRPRVRRPLGRGRRRRGGLRGRGDAARCRLASWGPPTPATRSAGSPGSSPSPSTRPAEKKERTTWPRRADRGANRA